MIGHITCMTICPLLQDAALHLLVLESLSEHRCCTRITIHLMWREVCSLTACCQQMVLTCQAVHAWLLCQLAPTNSAAFAGLQHVACRQTAWQTYSLGALSVSMCSCWSMQVTRHELTLVGVCGLPSRMPARLKKWCSGADSTCTQPAALISAR